MITHKTVLSGVTIEENWAVGVKLGLLLLDGDTELARSIHRIVVDPGDDIEARLEMVNQSLDAMGRAPLSQADCDRVVAHAILARSQQA